MIGAREQSGTVPQSHRAKLRFTTFEKNSKKRCCRDSGFGGFLSKLAARSMVYGVMRRAAHKNPRLVARAGRSGRSELVELHLVAED
jgi:hypothetical protein